MKKIDYTVIRNKNCVAFTIHYMDERFRFKGGEGEVCFKARNGFYVCSCLEPELELNEIYLRGKFKESDNEIVSLSLLETEQEAKEYVKKLHEALEDWANNWEGWEEEGIEKAKELEIERKVF